MMPPVSLDTALVIAGKMGSGKSTAVRAIAEKLGLKIVSFGDLIRAKALERGVQQARETLQQIGHEMFVTGGSRCLLRAALENAGIESGESVVFDGVRDRLVLDEIKAITKTMVTFYLDVGDFQRFERYLSKSPTESSMTFEEFQCIDGHPIEAGIGQLANKADLVIDARLPIRRVLDQIHKGMTNVAGRDST